MLSSNRGRFHAAKKYHNEVASVYTGSTSIWKSSMWKRLLLNYYFTTETVRTVRKTEREIFAFWNVTINLKTITKQVRAVRGHEIGRVFFWLGFSYTFDIHVGLGIVLNCFLFLNLFEKDTLPISVFLTALTCFVFVYNLIVTFQKAKSSLPIFSVFSLPQWLKKI